MRLPVDTSAVNFVSAGPPEPAIDFGTKAQKTDDKGLGINQVHLFVVGGGTREVITVKVAGELKGIGEFTPVKVTELVATTWNMDDRSGVSFRAAQGRGPDPAGLGLMERFFGIVLAMMVALMLLGFVLAHFGHRPAHLARSRSHRPSPAPARCLSAGLRTLNPYSRMALAVRGWGFEVLLTVVDPGPVAHRRRSSTGRAWACCSLGAVGIVVWRVPGSQQPPGPEAAQPVDPALVRTGSSSAARSSAATARSPRSKRSSHPGRATGPAAHPGRVLEPRRSKQAGASPGRHHRGPRGPGAA